MHRDLQARRSWMSGIGATLATLALSPRTAVAQTQRGFEPARHGEDDWLDQVPGRHRTFIDSSTVNGGGEAILYANNLFTANAAGYGLKDADIAIVVCLRHFSTVFAFNDRIWEKYGKGLSDAVQFVDPRSKQAPTSNLYNSNAYGPALPTLGNTLDGISKRGAQFAVCAMATRFTTGVVARALQADPEAIYREFVANLIPGSHMVAAGVVAVNRAQERGYTLLSAG